MKIYFTIQTHAQQIKIFKKKCIQHKFIKNLQQRAILNLQSCILNKDITNFTTISHWKHENSW